MEELFAARDIDPDTTIYSEAYHDLNGLPVLIEHWGCDGFSGASFVIPKAMIGSHDEQRLIALLRTQFDFGVHLLEQARPPVRVRQPRVLPRSRLSEIERLQFRHPALEVSSVHR
jgi:hypothetical protein